MDRAGPLWRRHRRACGSPSSGRNCRPVSSGETSRMTGDDRITWLQSIISNDILPLQAGHGRYSSFLTHKGKMLSYFRVYQQPEVSSSKTWEKSVSYVSIASKISSLRHQGQNGELCRDLGTSASEWTEIRGGHPNGLRPRRHALDYWILS